MYAHYGIDDKHICCDCCNFRKYRAGNKCVSKCAAYGLTRSAASDWNGRKSACGLFNKPFDSSKCFPLIETLKHSDDLYMLMQCEGQISLEDLSSKHP